MSLADLILFSLTDNDIYIIKLRCAALTVMVLRNVLPFAFQYLHLIEYLWPVSVKITQLIWTMNLIMEYL